MEEIEKLGSDPDKARVRTFEQDGGDWFEVTRIGINGPVKTRKKLTDYEVSQLNPLPRPGSR